MHRLMVKLSTPIKRAKLFKHIVLHGKLNNDTRWNLTYSMLQKTCELLDYVALLNEEHLDFHPLNASAERKVDVLVRKLSDSNEVLLKLQIHDCALLQLRANFDVLSEVHPSLEAQLVANARIVHLPHFESWVVKLQDRNQMDLATSEKRTLRSLLHNCGGNQGGDDDSETIMDRAVKQLRSNGVDSTSAFLDTRLPLPTSNLHASVCFPSPGTA